MKHHGKLVPFAIKKTIWTRLYMDMKLDKMDGMSNKNDSPVNRNEIYMLDLNTGLVGNAY